MFCMTSCIKMAVGGVFAVGCMYYTAKVVAVGCMYPVAKALLPKTTASDPPPMVSTEADRKRIEELEQQVKTLTKAYENQRSLANAVQYTWLGLQNQVDRYSNFCFRLPYVAASFVRQSSWGRDASKEDVTDTFMELTDEFYSAVVSNDRMEQFLAKYPCK